jgi:hypothetical protein
MPTSSHLTTCPARRPWDLGVGRAGPPGSLWEQPGGKEGCSGCLGAGRARRRLKKSTTKRWPAARAPRQWAGLQRQGACSLARPQGALAARRLHKGGRILLLATGRGSAARGLHKGGRILLLVPAEAPRRQVGPQPCRIHPTASAAGRAGKWQFASGQVPDQASPGTAHTAARKRCGVGRPLDTAGRRWYNEHNGGGGDAEVLWRGAAPAAHRGAVGKLKQGGEGAAKEKGKQATRTCSKWAEARGPAPSRHSEAKRSP